MALRGGINTRTWGDVPGFSGISAGFGFYFEKFKIDYGFIPVGKLDWTHRFSVSTDF
jgi:hypothetical protein